MHGVKLIGYGFDKKQNLNFWICQNSCGTGWRMNGFFNIKEMEINFGEEAYSCYPHY